MKLTLLQANAIHSVSLPEKMNGQFFVPYTNVSGKTEKLLSISPDNGSWTLNCGSKSYICVNNNSDKVRAYRIDGKLNGISICIRQTQEKVTVLFENDAAENVRFHKYVLSGDITIGADEGNDDICFKTNLIMGHSAEIKYHGEWFEYIEKNPSAFTFINGVRTKQKDLKPGDLIYIMGFSIIVGKGILALNNIGSVLIHSMSLKKFNYPLKNNEPIIKFFDEGKQDRYFSISPRFINEIVPMDISVEDPPRVNSYNNRPAFLQLGPSFTMGAASAVTAAFTIINGVNDGRGLTSVLPSLVMSASMMMSAMVWPVIAKAYESAHNRKLDKDLKTKYIQYLEDIRKQITDELDKQSSALTINFPSLDEISTITTHRTERLWERSVSNSDFLEISLGKGDAEALGEVNFQKEKLETHADILRKEMEKLRNEPRVMHDTPIVISLKKNRVIGVVGKLEDRAKLVRSIVMQIVGMHSYNDVSLAVIYNSDEHEYWEYMRWYPHTWNSRHDTRYIASGTEELKIVSASLEQALAGNSDNDEQNSSVKHYVIICTSYELYQKTNLITHIINSGEKSKFSVVLAFDSIANLPKECDAIITVDQNSDIHFTANDKVIGFEPLATDNIDFRQNAVSLANITLNSAENKFKLPNKLTFLEMYGVSKIEELNCLSRWHESNPVMMLAAPIGVDSRGDIFYLDLHQRMHGPHGLIAGTTGSGKSEFIMTFILSLALNYSPEEVSFLLIDYKGGGMAVAFKNLPHIAGIITNLDGAAVNRSLISIESELKRRQQMFLKAGERFGTTINDIYTYQGLCREDNSLQKLQHLFIISDEFAELRKQQSDFMDKLISAARIGRSLGVHLILATQKPSGVVNEQIWSNSRFKICLKVQDREDSTEVIRCPDAASITQTGQFYMQVGYNEIFELGQSAWCGADYNPEESIDHSCEEIAIIDNTGRVISRAGLRAQRKQSAVKQINLITKYIADIAGAEKLFSDHLWLEPLPEIIYQFDLKKKYPLGGEFKATVGEYDIPEEQQQNILRVSAEDGNILLCGSDGSGKTMFLTSYIFDYLSDVPASRSAFYILDFSSGSLKIFENYNAVGAVITIFQSDKLKTLMSWLQKEFALRQEKLSNCNMVFSDYVKNNSDIPAITVVISNYGAFKENYEDYEDVVLMLSKDGGKFGIFFIISEISTTFIKYKVLQNFRQHFTMRLDDGAYSSVVGRTNGKTPMPYLGRGLTDVAEDMVCEFQTAVISEGDINDFVRLKQAEINSKFPDKAFKIKSLPECYTINEALLYKKPANPDLAPLALDANFAEPEYIDLSVPIIPVLYSTHASVTVLQAFADYFGKNFKTVVIDAKKELTVPENCDYVIGAASCDKVRELYDELVNRHKAVKAATMSGQELPELQRLVCLINGYDALENIIKDEAIKTEPEDVQTYVTKQLLGLEKLLLGSVYDCKITFVIIDRAASLYHCTDKEWFKQYVRLNSYLWLGDNLSTEEIFRHEKTSESKTNPGNDMGYIVTKGKCKRIKFLNCVEE